MIDAGRFEALRPYLFSIAYRMLGSAAEAEDVLQDAWLRSAKAPADVRSDRAWLAAVVTRLCLDRLKSARAQREEYVGPWLPEPVPSEALPAPESAALQRESVTVAFLVMLEALSPSERAAFLLREVLDYDYAEIAEILDAAQPAARQLVHRAKQRLAGGRRRFSADPDRHREVVARFFQAVESGDVAGLESMLVRDATLTADGGGKVIAALRVVEGAGAIARFFAGLGRKATAESSRPRVELTESNGEPALLVFRDDRLETVFTVSVDQDRIASIYAVRNPEKLAWLEERLGRVG